MVLVIKVSNIIRKHTNNRRLLLICILLLSHSFIFFRFYFLSIYGLFLFNYVIYVFLLLGLCILIVRLPWLRFFHAFSSVVRQMAGYNSPSRGTARTLPKFLCCSQNFCVFLCIVCFVSFCVLFVCKCVLYKCHRVATQLQLTNISISISIFEGSAVRNVQVDSFDCSEDGVVLSS
jgi:hypothetical protein